MASYDFYLGTRAEIRADIPRYLLAVKRMLPRWANSLPDSEFQMMQALIENRLKTKRPVFVETGIGATTLLFLHYAMERNGRLISWDMNGSKASFLRTVACETLEQLHQKPVMNHWTFVQSATLSPHTGMAIVEELTDRVSFSHHDSDHTWETISGEISALLPLVENGGIICVDDANQIYQHTYEPIINMQRRKLGLKPIAPLAGNTGKPHNERIEGMLQETFAATVDVATGFAEKLADDLYYRWYAADRASMGKVGMERMNALQQRFVAYQVSRRRTRPTSKTNVRKTRRPKR